jgi:hypothetical protein
MIRGGQGERRRVSPAPIPARRRHGEFLEPVSAEVQAPRVGVPMGPSPSVEAPIFYAFRRALEELGLH